MDRRQNARKISATDELGFRCGEPALTKYTMWTQHVLLRWGKVGEVIAVRIKAYYSANCDDNEAAVDREGFHQLADESKRHCPARLKLAPASTSFLSDGSHAKAMVHALIEYFHDGVERQPPLLTRHKTISSFAIHRRLFQSEAVLYHNLSLRLACRN